MKDDMKPSTQRVATPLLLILSGAVWGLWYFGMNWVGWGEPGTAAYRRYEIYNRLAPVVFLLLLTGTESAHRLLRGTYGRAGRAGARVAAAGLLLLAAGSALEFWAFSGAAYAAGSLRGIGWTTYCAGLLLFYLGTATLGFALSRVRGFILAGALLMIWLPAGAAMAGLGALTSKSLPALSSAVAVCGAGYVLLGLGLREGLPSPPEACVV